MANLPTSVDRQCDVVINDIDFDIAAHSVILILIAFRFVPTDAAPIMPHLRYFTFISDSIL